MKKERNSNIELLRIISILLIVISHYSNHNGILLYEMNIGFNRVFLETIQFGDIGTLLFVLISGYCLIDSSKLKISKLLKIWLQVLFYSILFYILFIFFGKESFSLFGLIKVILPLGFNQYWFVTNYVILYLFHPYINKLLNSIKRKEHLNLIMCSIAIFSLLHMITTKDYYANELIQFIMFYIIGAYFGKYKNTFFKDGKRNILIILGCFIIMTTSIVIFDFIGNHYSVFAEHSRYLFNRTSIFSVLIGVCLLNIFANKKTYYNKYINVLSSCTFGVYLISDNYYIRPFLWIELFKNSEYVNSCYLVFHMIACVLIVYWSSVIIDFIRLYTVGNLYNKCISPKIDKLQSRKDIFNVS